ncbi:Trans-enoyl reductase [Fulvia fulva]|uniref:Trans-enoyl reductase n=1 Tax=Passalora fulva TaxID=5499 RepID=A0A9Q8UTY6_PASFU|nr:Trans-enoyl reductase [Fulvia fulva]KAK4613630.1 Trans-enoyl reductase [Fulvia fulva]KAK4614453.1 Trans-enoyl reductase [Fulvia fulva]UJO22257.1 Trans-enoyl reductase [Fulvia fulva]WPV20722.1 Trans-enoyl reductase [Fulvia fulva]WPV35656.1 Trans-enoyl reductase [Fulvia fulva]
MSVEVQRLPLTSAFYDLDDALQKDIDWGTATPISHDEHIESDFSSAAYKRGTKRPAVVDVIPSHQKALLLHELRQPFVKQDHAVPQINGPEEILIEVQAIGLNPIDWKSVDYGFGIPVLPYVSGRDFAGVVVKAPLSKSHIQEGDTILCPSTDYRDLRKAAYQEYAIASHSTVCRLPRHVSTSQGAAIGVAYVAAALAMGVCLGLPMPALGSNTGPDILDIVRSTPLGSLPADTVAECIAIKASERPKAGDWIVIWGGSSTSALFLSQIAKLAGLRVILVVDVAKHGAWLIDTSGCVCIDSHDAERAVHVICGIAGSDLRFGVDTVGKETSEHLAQCLAHDTKDGSTKAHLVGLAALPKQRKDGIVYHSVPVKLFHEVPRVGSSLMSWLEEALESRAISLPRIEEAPGGLEGINAALDRMRQGHVSGKRLVVPLPWRADTISIYPC